MMLALFLITWRAHPAPPSFWSGCRGFASQEHPKCDSDAACLMEFCNGLALFCIREQSGAPSRGSTRQRSGACRRRPRRRLTRGRHRRKWRRLGTGRRFARRFIRRPRDACHISPIPFLEDPVLATVTPLLDPSSQSVGCGTRLSTVEHLYSPLRRFRRDQDFSASTGHIRIGRSAARHCGETALLDH